MNSIFEGEVSTGDIEIALYFIALVLSLAITRYIDSSIVQLELSQAILCSMIFFLISFFSLLGLRDMIPTRRTASDLCGRYESKRLWSFWLLSPFTGYVEHRKYPGWKAFLPFYRRKCPVHGEYIDYPHGFRSYFLCPKCKEMN